MPIDVPTEPVKLGGHETAFGRGGQPVRSVVVLV